MQLSEDFNPIKGLLVYYVNTGMMPKAKAESYLKEQALINLGLTKRLQEQGVESMFIGVSHQTDSNSDSRVEYIDFENPSTMPSEIGDLIKGMGTDYLNLNKKYTQLFEASIRVG